MGGTLSYRGGVGGRGGVKSDGFGGFWGFLGVLGVFGGQGSKVIKSDLNIHFRRLTSSSWWSVSFAFLIYFFSRRTLLQESIYDSQHLYFIAVLFCFGFHSSNDTHFHHSILLTRLWILWHYVALLQPVKGILQKRSGILSFICFRYFIQFDSVWYFFFGSWFRTSGQGTIDLPWRK